MFVSDNTETLSKNDFERLSSFIYNEVGIKMPESKKPWSKRDYVRD